MNRSSSFNFLMFYLPFIYGQISTHQCQSSSEINAVRANLRKYLMDNAIANVNVPPAQSMEPQNIEIGLSLIINSLQGIDEVKNSIGIAGNLIVTWNSSALGYRWKPEDFCGISKLTINKAYNSIWTPKLVITNMLNLLDFRDLMDKAPAEIDGATGMVSMNLYSTFELSCNLGLKTFPKDSHICPINVTMTSELVYVTFKNTGIRPICTPNGLDHSQWVYSGSRAFVDYQVLPNISLPTYTFQIILQRNVLFHMVTLIIPIILLAIVGSAIFIIPPDSGEKMSVCFVVLLSFFFIFSTVISSLPPNSTGIPILYHYLLAIFILTILATLFAAILLNITTIIERRNDFQTVNSSSVDEEFTNRTDQLKKFTEVGNVTALIVYLVIFILTTIICFSIINEESEQTSPKARNGHLENGTLIMKNTVFFDKNLNNCLQCYLNPKTQRFDADFKGICTF